MSFNCHLTLLCHQPCKDHNIVYNTILRAHHTTSSNEDFRIFLPLSVLQSGAGVLDCTENKSTIPCRNLQVYSHNVKEKCTKFPAIPRIFWNFWQRPKVTGHYKKIQPLYLRKNVLATTGNLKVKYEQTKHKSV